MNARHTLTALPLLLLATACATPVAVETPAGEHQLEAELRVFQEAQQVFREKNMGTHEFDFEGQGRVTVREILLEGFPGNTYLKCRFHYQNRTAKPVVQSWVSLDVLDKDEKEAVKAAVGGFRFDTPVGKDLKRFVLAGIGVLAWPSFSVIAVSAGEGTVSLLESTVLQTSVTALAALCFSIYSHYKKRQAAVENLMRTVLLSDRSAAELLPEMLEEMQRLDVGFAFRTQPGPEK